MGILRIIILLTVALLIPSLTEGVKDPTKDCGKGFYFDGGWNACGCCIPETCPPPMGYTYTKSSCRCPDESWTPCFDDSTKKYTICLPPGEQCPNKLIQDPGNDKDCLQKRTTCLMKCVDPKALLTCQKACPTQDSCKKKDIPKDTGAGNPEKLPYLVGGTGANHPRVRHPVIGQAEMPSTECPQGDWILLDTQYRMEQRKKCVLTNTELHGQKRSELGTIRYYLWAITNIPIELFEHDPCAVYDEQCEYTAAHTWQCSSNNAIVNRDQTKTVSVSTEGDCHTYA